MAYMSQDTKKELAPAIKAVLKKYGVKGSIGVRNLSTLVVNIKSGQLDFIAADRKIQEFRKHRGEHHILDGREYLSINPHYVSDWHNKVEETTIADFFQELISAMKGDRWFDKSDIQTDYFDQAYFIEINVGKWDKPYQLN